MKRKTYMTARERKVDQLIGFIAFLCVNGALWVATNRLLAWGTEGVADDDQFRFLVLLLPWIVNGTLLALAFIFRPQLGVGYLASLSAILLSGIAVGTLFLFSCFAALAVGLPASQLLGDRLASALLLLVWIGLLLGGLLVLGRIGLVLIKDWWSSDGQTPADAEIEQERSTPPSSSE